MKNKITNFLFWLFAFYALLGPFLAKETSSVFKIPLTSLETNNRVIIFLSFSTITLLVFLCKKLDKSGKLSSFISPILMALSGILVFLIEGNIVMIIIASFGFSLSMILASLYENKFSMLTCLLISTR